MRVRQHYKYDCGAACLAYISMYYGAHYTLAELSLYCGCSKDGISIKGIIDGAAKIGLEAKGYNSPDKDISTLKDISSPFIVHTKSAEGYYHFIVVCSVSQKYIRIMDPQYGTHKKISHKEFCSIWSGYVIIATPTPQFKQREKKISIPKKMYALFAMHKKECLLSFVGAATCILIGTSTSFFLQSFIDKAIADNSSSYLKLLSFLIIALSVLTLYIGYCATIYLIRCSIKIDSSLATTYINKLMALPMPFFNNHPIGDITSRMDDIVKIRSFVTTGIISTLTALLTLFGTLIFMFLFYYKMAFLVMCFIPVYIGLYYISGRTNKRLGKELAISNSTLESGLIENISGISTIKHYNCYNIVLNKLGAAYVKYSSAFYRSANAVNIFESAAQGVGIAIIAVVFICGTVAISNKELSVGEFVGFYTLCSFFTTPLNRLMGMGELIANAVVAFERLQEILDLKDEKESNNGHTAINLNGKLKSMPVKFCNVGFCYPGREELLSNLSFTINPGEITVIAGENGCGKTTVASLVSGYLAPTEGNIMIGNIDISIIPLNRWRENIAYIEQSAHLFNTTILENITCKENDNNIEIVLGICQKVGLLPLLQKLPMGLLTKVGNNGKILSGGECQKICIARALYKKAQIYIFDEPTSHLDYASQSCIAEILKELKINNKHILLISHKEKDFELANKTIMIKSNCSSGNLPCTNSAG